MITFKQFLSESIGAMVLFHGYSKGISGVLTPPIHFAYDEKLARMYGPVGVFSVHLKNPLVISTDAAFIASWIDAGMEVPDEDPASMAQLHQYEKHVSGQGHDGVIFKEGLWDKSQAFQDTFGQDGVIVFDPSAVSKLKTA